MISTLVDKTWFSRYPHCQHIIYDNGSEFKLHFEALCGSYSIKHKPTSVKNPQANAILKRVHQVLMMMLRTAELDMANSVAPSDVDAFLIAQEITFCRIEGVNTLYEKNVAKLYACLSKIKMFCLSVCLSVCLSICLSRWVF